MFRKLFLTSASILMLAIAATLLLRLTPTLGAASQIATPTEVAVLTGILPHGGTIPLPLYRDGSQATEDECQWAVSPQFVDQGANYSSYFYCYASASVGGSPLARGRVVSCFHDALQFTGSVNFLIIATRGAASGPTPTQQTSWGAIKLRSR